MALPVSAIDDLKKKGIITEDISKMSEPELNNLIESKEDGINTLCKFYECILNAGTEYEESGKQKSYSRLVAEQFYNNHSSYFELLEFFRLLSIETDYGFRNMVADSYKFYFGTNISTI